MVVHWIGLHHSAKVMCGHYRLNRSLTPVAPMYYEKLDYRGYIEYYHTPKRMCLHKGSQVKVEAKI